VDPQGYPHQIAVLCDLRDAQGRVLLLHRRKEPNIDLYSPIGGKLELASGESPLMAARREIREEAGIDVPAERLRLGGIVSERGYESRVNWLMFWVRVEGAVEVAEREFREGRLEWHDPRKLPSDLGGESMPRLAMPETDRKVIWPLVLANPEGFFSVYIDCESRPMRWAVEAGNLPPQGVPGP